ncbi:hypothetical protein [Paracoccus halophilus]|nr:hypothetical protein [Paracoccus halophilus]
MQEAIPASLPDPPGFSVDHLTDIFFVKGAQVDRASDPSGVGHVV